MIQALPCQGFLPPVGLTYRIVTSDQLWIRIDETLESRSLLGRAMNQQVDPPRCKRFTQREQEKANKARRRNQTEKTSYHHTYITQAPDQPRLDPETVKRIVLR